MRAGVLVVVAMLLSVLAAPAHAADETAPVAPGLKVPNNHVRVLLPEGYDANPCRHYPVLFLLHGVGDTWQDWTTKTDLVAFAKQFPVIIVMPDGGKNPEAGWYSDWKDGSRQWESFHMSLVPWVDAHYRTLGDGHRMIAGFSMGGFGAMSYAARHPGTFKVAAAFSGIVDTMYAFPASGPFFQALHANLGTPDDRVWGDQLQDEAVWRAHNPTDLAAALKGTSLFLYTGMGAPTGTNGDDPSKAPNYLTEHFIFQTNLSFMRALDAAGVAHTDDVHPGYHDWPYFSAGLHWALPQMVPLVTTPNTTEVCSVVAAAADNGGSLPATGAAPDALVLLALVVTSAALLRTARSKAARPRSPSDA